MKDATNRTRLKYIDLIETCPGFPFDDRVRSHQESWCIILLVHYLLREIRVFTDGIRQVNIWLVNTELSDLSGVVPNFKSDRGSGFQGITNFVWRFDFKAYFDATAPDRSRVLCDAVESAMIALAEHRRWSQPEIREVFARVRQADYCLKADHTKACRSPDGKYQARVSYSVDREEFRIDVTVTRGRTDVVLQKTIYRGGPGMGLSVQRHLGKPHWTSPSELAIPIEHNAAMPDGDVVIKVP